MSNLNKAIMENFANNNTSANNWKNNNKGYNGNPKVGNNNATNNGEQLTAANSGFGPFNWVRKNSRTCVYAGGAVLGTVVIIVLGRKAYDYITDKKSNKKSKEEAAAANDANKGK